MKLFPGCFRQFVYSLVEVGHRINTEVELDFVFIPAVEMLRLGKVGIAPKLDVPKSSKPAQNGCSVKIVCRIFVAGAISTAVDDVQGFARIGK